MSYNAVTSTVGEAGNAVYFTREQFVAGLRLPFPSLVKQFLHFIRSPPALIHPNVFRILMGCSVLNSLYQLDTLLVVICFIYFLKLGIGGCLSMSAHSPRRGQLVNWVEKVRLDRIFRLLDITKKELHHKLLLSVKNLQKLGASPFPYIVHRSSSSFA